MCRACAVYHMYVLMFGSAAFLWLAFLSTLRYILRSRYKENWAQQQVSCCSTRAAETHVKIDCSAGSMDKIRYVEKKLQLF